MTHELAEDRLDLDAYFQRIGYDGERTPTLATLQAIQLRHATAIPFENLTPLLRQPVRLELAALQEKLVQNRRGGYCFEHNLLLLAVLRALGFRASGLAARVRWNVPDGVVTPRSHMLLRIELDEQTYLADVGFGGQTLTGPLALLPDRVQPTPHEPFRLVADGDGFLMQAQLGQEWRTLYRFDLQQQFLPDYQVTSWYLSNHPNSHFVTGLTAARPDHQRRYALRNNQLSIHHLHGETEQYILTTVAALRGVLEECFQITPPATADLDPTLQRLIDSTQT